MRDPSQGGPEWRSMLLSKRTALIVLAAAIALCTTACFPDSAPGNPRTPTSTRVYQAINRDRTEAGLPPLAHSPKLENLAGTWAWQMSVDNSLHHQNLSAVLNNSDFGAFTRSARTSSSPPATIARTNSKPLG